MADSFAKDPNVQQQLARWTMLVLVSIGLSMGGIAVSLIEPGVGQSFLTIGTALLIISSFMLSVVVTAEMER